MNLCSFLGKNASSLFEVPQEMNKAFNRKERRTAQVVKCVKKMERK